MAALRLLLAAIAIDRAGRRWGCKKVQIGIASVWRVGSDLGERERLRESVGERRRLEPAVHLEGAIAAGFTDGFEHEPRSHVDGVIEGIVTFSAVDQWPVVLLRWAEQHWNAQR